MKITKRQLRRIIKETIEAQLNEGELAPSSELLACRSQTAGGRDDGSYEMRKCMEAKGYYPDEDKIKRGGQALYYK